MSAHRDPFVGALSTRLDGDICCDDGTLAAYATDASNHRVVPAAVVFPRTPKDVVTTVDACGQAGVAVTSRGAGTSIGGGAIGAGVVIDCSRHLTRVLAVDPETRTAIVEPGVVLDRLQEAASPYGLRFGPDPSTHATCTLGGMVGTNACGSHSLAWGTTAANVVALDVVGGDAAVLRLDRSTTGALRDRLVGLRDAALGPIRSELGRFPRQVSGYALHHLLPEHGVDLAKAFVGSEGTCGVVTTATVALVPVPVHRALVVAGFDDIVAAANAAAALVVHGPLTIEGIDAELVRAYDARPGPQPRPELPQGGGWLLLEVTGSDEIDRLARAARDVGAVDVHVVSDRAAQRAIWRIRERGAGLASRTPEGREGWPGWEDAAVPVAALAGYVRDFTTLLRRHRRHGVLYGHFGEGCVHVRIDHDLLSQSGRRAYRAFQHEAADLVVAHGGSLSGEHGDGRARSELLGRMYGPGVMAAFAAFKHTFDPNGVLNPSVVVDPAPLDADLRLALPRGHPTDLAFGYREDNGDWDTAMRRCVGIGACRKESGGGMCPSYRATSDERHSTRGRARLLFEMTSGLLREDAWRSADVHEALDLCLACKACATECPTSVDMATYKAEFLHQHYRGRFRPRPHYSLGWLPLWLRAARRRPRLANAALGMPGAAWLAGVDRRRTLPRLALGGGTPSLKYADPITLWVDTFTASFGGGIAADAISVLEGAGYSVSVVGPEVCCGLTWVSTGQLGTARRVMSRAVAALTATPGRIVVLEPSCAAAMRTDAPGLLGTTDADRVADRVVTLAEALEGRSLEVAPMDVTAIVQFHCHQRAVLGTEADHALLTAVAVDVRSVDEGCCGMAGNFGMEPAHYDVSLTCADQSFLPVVRDAPNALLLADGFSCRLQIEELTGRRPLHLAQLLRPQVLPQTPTHNRSTS